MFSPQNISWFFKLPQFIAAFFERFYPSFPAIHRPTFDATAGKEPLLQAVACIGAMYHSPGSNQSISSALFEAGLRSLDAYVIWVSPVLKTCLYLMLMLGPRKPFEISGDMGHTSLYPLGILCLV